MDDPAPAGHHPATQGALLPAGRVPGCPLPLTGLTLPAFGFPVGPDGADPAPRAASEWRFERPGPIGTRHALRRAGESGRADAAEPSRFSP